MIDKLIKLFFQTVASKKVLFLSFNVYTMQLYEQVDDGKETENFEILFSNFPIKIYQFHYL